MSDSIEAKKSENMAGISTEQDISEKLFARPASPCQLQLVLRLVPLTLCLLILVLIPSASKHILKSILECTAVHVNQALFLFGLRVTEHGYKTQIPSNHEQTERGGQGERERLNVLVHFHEMDHRLVMQNDVALRFLDLVALRLAIRMIP